MKALRLTLVIVVAAPFAPFLVSGCNGGTAVFDATNPKQCPTGNGCPMVACACGDGSFMIDSTCELGKCTPPDAMCADKCSTFMGVKTFVATKNDNVTVPECDALGERMLVNKCGEGTELLASTCQAADAGCSPAALSFWKCVIEGGVLACKHGALHVDGCQAETPDVCTGAPT